TLKLISVLVLSLVLLTSLIGLATSYSYPEQVVDEIIRAVITQKIDLNYSVLVKSSIIYDNRTVLKPGEIVYAKFLEGLNITCGLELSSSKELRDFRGSYEVLVNISSPIWFKELVIGEGDARELLGKVRSLYINFTYLRDYISRIEKEVGSSRAYTISVVFRARTSIGVVNVSKSYTLTSESKLELYYDTGKPVIDIRIINPESKYVDSVKQTRITNVSLLLVSMDIITYRILAMATSITSAAALAFTLVIVTRGKPSKKITTPLLENKYRDLMISGELKQIKQVVAVIRVRSFTDLVKVATIRRKPIVRFSDSKTKFAIVEEDVIYLYEEDLEKQK
ncbi:MAG: DUF5305 family protein, partial [Zestosphaera sp.]